MGCAIQLRIRLVGNYLEEMQQIIKEEICEKCSNDYYVENQKLQVQLRMDTSSCPFSLSPTPQDKK